MIVQKVRIHRLVRYVFACFPFQKPVTNCRKGKIKVQGVPQSQAPALSRHLEEEETDKTKQAQVEQTYEKHQD